MQYDSIKLDTQYIDRTKSKTSIYNNCQEFRMKLIVIDMQNNYWND